jgi:hypothetical protein
MNRAVVLLYLAGYRVFRCLMNGSPVCWIAGPCIVLEVCSRLRALAGISQKRTVEGKVLATSFADGLGCSQ